MRLRDKTNNIIKQPCHLYFILIMLQSDLLLHIYFSYWLFVTTCLHIFYLWSHNWKFSTVFCRNFGFKRKAIVTSLLGNFSVVYFYFLLCTYIFLSSNEYSFHLFIFSDLKIALQIIFSYAVVFNFTFSCVL